MRAETWQLTKEDREILVASVARIKMWGFSCRELLNLKRDKAPHPYATWSDYVRAGIWENDMTGAERREWVVASNARALQEQQS